MPTNKQYFETVKEFWNELDALKKAMFVIKILATIVFSLLIAALAFVAITNGKYAAAFGIISVTIATIDFSEDMGMIRRRWMEK